MTVLLGGLRVLKVNAGQSNHGVFTRRPETLTNDFFVNLLDMGTQWKRTSDAADSFEGCCRMKSDVRWTDSRVDLVFGSNSEFRARGGPRVRRREGQVRARLRRRLGQGDESQRFDRG
jgi:catalase-peroxidase